jgi:hypothetical protein
MRSRLLHFLRASRLINLDANDAHAIVSQPLILNEPSDTSKLTAHVSDTMFQIDASRIMVVAPTGDAPFPLNSWTWQDLYQAHIKAEA